MMLNFLKGKLDLIKKYQTHPSDCGSVFVKIALLTGRIEYLSKHTIANKKDHSAHIALIKDVQARRKMISYVKKHHTEKYEELMKSLGLRIKE